MDSTDSKMTIEIWSDVLCPFCYIGKRKFEAALAGFAGRDEVSVVWKSFQLDPDAPNTGPADYYQHLSARKGWSVAQTRQITAQVAQMAAEAGLEYHFEKAVTANSFDAHRFTHLAAAQGLQDAAEEALFRAHFVEGKNIGDRAMLEQLGADIGLDSAAVRAVLDSDQYADAVQRDILEAQQLGVRGVPFFVFDRKYAVSGAQDSRAFLNMLEKTQAERQTATHPRPASQPASGQACTPEEDCSIF